MVLGFEGLVNGRVCRDKVGVVLGFRRPVNGTRFLNKQKKRKLGGGGGV